APALEPQQLRGVVLAGGLYDVAAAAAMTGLPGWATGVELRALTGSQTPLNTANVETISTIRAITADFPPTWITAADGDPLTHSQAIPFADALTRAGVPVSASFPSRGAQLPQDYQFLLTLDESKRAFASLINFAEAVSR
ncbi:MAG TPA: alpha/beta hydrolase, partial [Microbacteriaceae bacterium]|nr:alpha/beta hydrolase [Microbacteriaceae bacterium]